MNIDTSQPDDPVARALAEDLGGRGDITGCAFVPAERTVAARIVAREACVLAGLQTAERAFLLVDPSLAFLPRARDGDGISPGSAVCEVTGRARSILAAERTALNFLQRLSGVATLTRAFVEAVSGTGARILDTRKTTPGLRALEKAAVRAGGGENHRFGLHDAVLVKDNHLALGWDAASLQARIDALRQADPDLLIEFEADTLEQVRALADLRGIDVILLDNMDPATMREAVRLRRPGLQFEASGGLTLQTVRAAALAGVDRISIGALTHSAPAIDLSLEIGEGRERRGDHR